MTARELVRLVENNQFLTPKDVNPLFDVLMGNDGGKIRLIGHDGRRRNPIGGAVLSTLEYTQVVQSAAAGGPHIAALHSGTATGKTVAPTAVNAVLLVRDDYTAIGMGKSLRIYATAGTNYGSLTSDLNGDLILAGVGTSAGTLNLVNLVATGDITARDLTATRTLYLTGATSAPRIIADFSNATLATRAYFQTSAVNTSSIVGVLPNGSSTESEFTAYSHSTPASAANTAIIRASAAQMQIRSDSPSGSFQPMRFYTSNTEALTISTTGAITSPTQPRCRVYDSTATVSHATSGAWQTVAFPTEAYDVGTLHSTSVNTSRITFTAAGTYKVGGGIAFATNATGTRGIRILLNGATPLKFALVPPSTIETAMTIETEYAFAANDYVELQGFQSSGGALNMVGIANYVPVFESRLVA